MKKISKLIFVGYLLFNSLQLTAQEKITVFVNDQKMSDIKANIGNSNSVGEVVSLPSIVTTKNSGHWIEKGNTSVWKLPIITIGDYGIVPLFDKLILPEGAQIKAYSNDNSLTTQTFYRNENKDVTSFALPKIDANSVIVEIELPAIIKEKLEVEISKVGIVIINRNNNKMTGFGDAPSCFANVNCSEGAVWADQKRSVAKYMTIEGTSIGYCTGALINNTFQDCKNYFLSAQHCGMGASASELGQWIFYFNYEASGCTSPSSDAGLDQQTVVGCAKKASSGSSTSLPPDGSDFHLLELNSIPISYNVYYSGWNRKALNLISGNGAVIQHPLGDLKKISFWDNITVGGTSIVDFSVRFIPSSNGDGTIEPMSSGSPVFDNTKGIVGTISFGSTGCIGGNTSTIGAGGQFFYHWDDGTTASFQLKPWLDPSNSGALLLSGKNACGTSGIIENLINESISIYPNPAKTYIEIKTTETIDNISIYNAMGQKQLSLDNTKLLSLESLPNGVYIVIVQSKLKSFVEKLIIESY